MNRRQAWNALVYVIVFGSLVFGIQQQRTINKIEKRVELGQVGPRGPQGPAGENGRTRTRVVIQRRIVTRRIVLAGRTVKLKPTVVTKQVSRRGPRGRRGRQGPPGTIGPQGPQGQKGEKGDPGIAAFPPTQKLLDALCGPKKLPC